MVTIGSLLMRSAGPKCVFNLSPTRPCVQLPTLHLLTWRVHPKNQTLPGEGEQPADGETGSSAGGPDRLLPGTQPGRRGERGHDKKPPAGREECYPPPAE